MDFRVPDVKGIREKYAQLGSPLGCSPFDFTHYILWRISFERNQGEIGKLEHYLSYGTIGEALRAAGYRGEIVGLRGIPADMEKVVNAAFTYGYPEPERYMNDRWGLYRRLEFDAAYGALEKFVTDETHYFLEREGHKWVEGQHRFEGLDDTAYRSARARVIGSAVDFGIDYFHPKTGHDSAERRNENFRRSLEPWIRPVDGRAA